MKELLDSFKKMVLDNYTGELDDYILDALSIAILGLHLKAPELVTNKLPDILKNLTIFVDDKNLVEIAHEKVDNYAEDSFLSDGTIAVTRSLYFDDENGAITEKKYLLADQRELLSNPVRVIGEFIHEFTHLLRDGGIENKENDIIVHDGIGVMRYDKKKNKTFRKHINIEEGIVQRFTNQTLDLLYEFLNDKDLSENELLKKFNKKFPGNSYMKNTYPVHVLLIGYLCEDKGFSQAVDDSFDPLVKHTVVGDYYNSIMGSSSAFTFFSRDFDNLVDSTTKSEFEKLAGQLSKETETFLHKGKSSIYKKKNLY